MEPSYSTYRLVDERAPYEINDPGLTSAAGEAAQAAIERITSRLFSTAANDNPAFSATSANNQPGNLTYAAIEQAYEIIQDAWRVYYFVSKLFPATSYKDGQPALFRQTCDSKQVWLMHPDRFAEFEVAVRDAGFEPVEFDYPAFYERQLEQSKVRKPEWLNKLISVFCRP